MLSRIAVRSAIPASALADPVRARLASGGRSIVPWGLLSAVVLGLLCGSGLVAAAQPQAPSASPTALFVAIDTGSPARVAQVLKEGADPNARDDRGEPALIYALHADKPEVALVLLGAPGIDLDAENAYHQTALMVAAYQGRLDIVHKLIDADAEVNHVGWTALHFAASSGQLDVVRLLRENAAYLDAQSPNGTTALMMAARARHRPTCVYLVQEGADPTPTNGAGLSAAEFARRAGDSELAAWLEENAGAWRRRHPTLFSPADGVPGGQPGTDSRSAEPPAEPSAPANNPTSNAAPAAPGTAVADPNPR